MRHFELPACRVALTLTAVLVSVASFAGRASADVAPPPDYVEQCTVARAQQSGEQCVSCGDAYHGDTEACARKFEPEGYSRRCRTRGASTWSEVWCKSAGAVASPVSHEGPFAFAQPPPEEPPPNPAQIAGDPEPNPPGAGEPPPQRAAPGGGCGACVMAARQVPTGAGVGLLAGLLTLGLRRVRRRTRR